MTAVIATEPTQREDIAHIVRNLRERDRAEIFGLRWDDDEVSLTDTIFAVSGPMWRVWHYQGEPVAMSGVVPERPGVVMAGAFGTDKFSRVALSIVRWGTRWCIPRLQAAGYHRGYAYAMAANVDGRRFIELLGGVKEAYLHKYGRNREDYILYAWRLDEYG